MRDEWHLYFSTLLVSEQDFIRHEAAHRRPPGQRQGAISVPGCIVEHVDEVQWRATSPGWVWSRNSVPALILQFKASCCFHNVKTHLNLIQCKRIRGWNFPPGGKALLWKPRGGAALFAQHLAGSVIPHQSSAPLQMFKAAVPAPCS